MLDLYILLDFTCAKELLMLQMDLIFPLQGDANHCEAVVVALSGRAQLCRQGLYLLYIRIAF